MYLRQQLRAPNDSNGNPRRVWVLYRVRQPSESDPSSYFEIVHVRDEGYAGDPAIAGDGSVYWSQSSQLPSIDVPVSEYRRFLSVG